MAEITTAQMTIRQCAREICDLWDAYDGDFEAFSTAAQVSFRQLLERPDLMMSGFKVSVARASDLSVLYCDGEMTMLIGYMPFDVRIPIHDHGAWELMGVYRGEVENTCYERLDDRSVPGYAELREVETRTLRRGDMMMLPLPPYDVHSFITRAEMTVFAGMYPGRRPEYRRYFDPETNSYFEDRRSPD